MEANTNQTNQIETDVIELDEYPNKYKVKYCDVNPYQFAQVCGKIDADVAQKIYDYGNIDMNNRYEYIRNAILYRNIEILEWMNSIKPFTVDECSNHICDQVDMVYMWREIYRNNSCSETDVIDWFLNLYPTMLDSLDIKKSLEKYEYACGGDECAKYLYDKYIEYHSINCKNPCADNLCEILNRIYTNCLSARDLDNYKTFIREHYNCKIWLLEYSCENNQYVKYDIINSIAEIIYERNHEKIYAINTDEIDKINLKNQDDEEFIEYLIEQLGYNQHDYEYYRIFKKLYMHDIKCAKKIWQKYITKIESAIRNRFSGREYYNGNYHYVNTYTVFNEDEEEYKTLNNKYNIYTDLFTHACKNNDIEIVQWIHTITEESFMFVISNDKIVKAGYVEFINLKDNSNESNESDESDESNEFDKN